MQLNNNSTNKNQFSLLIGIIFLTIHMKFDSDVKNETKDGLSYG